jgi:sigma-B regulation protein RsbU (phosphoserine phosphatase)
MSDANHDMGGNAASEHLEDLEDLYENAPCGYLSIKPDGRIAKANATFAKWMGWPADELIGERLLDLLNVAGRIFYETHFAPLLRMQGFFNEVALDLVTQQGKRLPVLVNATERRDAAGEHLFTRLTVFNATDRRRYERELVEARAALETSLLDERETSALREQFIAVLSHDLRNPLSAISTGSDLLLRTAPNDRARSIAALINASANRMAGLIDNVMDFARGRLGGGLTLEWTPDASVDTLLHQVVSELQASMSDRTIDTDIALSMRVNCDTRRIGQLASNLLGNAITHGARDKPIRLGAAVNDGWFELFVANAGDPIPPAALEKIFEPFERGTLRASLQGLGLGLYISHQIAKAHGGNLGVVSTPVETRFTFRMPLTHGFSSQGEADGHVAGCRRSSEHR